MTALSILETFLSLTIQAAILIYVLATLVRKPMWYRNADYCWAMLHASVLMLTAAAFLLPHLRIAVWGDLYPTENYPPDGAALQVLGNWVTWVWGGGVVVMVLIEILGMVHASLIVRRAQSSEVLRNAMIAAVPDLANSARPIDLRFTDNKVGAFCWQIHRPVIAVPRAVVGFPIAEQVAIVRHELAHLRRQHPLHLFLQRIVEAIFWFHPIVWWASKQAATAREIRCDQDAVSNHQEVAAYLRSLLRLIEMHLDEPTLLPAGLSFLGSSSLLKRRVSLLIDSFEKPNCEPKVWKFLWILSLVVVVCAFVWLPVNPRASRRADWSPWPIWSARTLDAIGVTVRDYEIDGHRLDGYAG